MITFLVFLISSIRTLPPNLGNDSRILGTSALEKLLNTGKTLCDILGGSDTAGMEGSHGKLCTGLTDGLSSDDTNSLADIDKLDRWPD